MSLARLDPHLVDREAADVHAEDRARRASSASWRSLASLMPPALPRPPISTCALTTQGYPTSSAAATASATVVAGAPVGDRDVMAGKELLALVFEEVHRRPLTLLVLHCRTLMALPKNVNWVTFDVYGTLIDWETGIYDAFKAEASRDGFTIDRDELIPMFHEISQDIESGSYELYAEVLRRTAVQIAKRLEWPLEPSRAGFLPDSIPRWKPFKETNAQLEEDREEVRDRADLEHRRQAPRPDAPAPAHRLRPRRHRPAGALLQARPGALQGVPAPDRGRQEGLGPHRVEPVPRRRAARQAQGARDLGEPHGRGRSRPAARRPTPRSPRWPRPRSSSAPRRAACERSRCTRTSSSRRVRCGRRRAPPCAAAVRRSSSTRPSTRTSSSCSRR